MRRGFLILVAILALAWTGCADPYAAVLKERLQTQEEMVTILSNIRDEASMTAGREALLLKYRRFDEISRRVATLHKPSGEALRHLEMEFGPRFQQAVDRSKKELVRVMNLPGGLDFIESLEKLK